MQRVVHLPPVDRDWTPRERLLLDGLLIALEQDGIDATRYEWLVEGEVWCSFREPRARVRVELGRVGRAYHLHWPDAARHARTLDFGHALERIRSGWRSGRAPSRESR